MKRRWVMFQVGYRAGRRSGLRGSVHRWALAAAAVAMVITGWVLLGATTVAQQRDERIAAREPVFTLPGDPAAVGRWRLHADVFDGRQFLVLYLAGDDPTTAAPPGLPRWPHRGEAFISPALLAADREGALRSRYGTYAGAIGATGLAEPSEWLVYYRPPDDAAFDRADGRMWVRGFGIDPQRMHGDLEARSSLVAGNWDATDVMVLTGCVVALPCAVLIFVAVRTNAERRDRRLALLDALGASASARAWVLAGEAAAPVLLGALGGAVIALLTTMRDVTLPLTGYTVAQADIARARILLPALVTATTLTLLALVVAVQLRRLAKGQTRPRIIAHRLHRWAPAIFVAGVAAAAWGAQTSGGKVAPGYPAPMVAFLTGLILALASLPAVLGLIAARSGGLIAATGRMRGWPSALIGGSSLAVRPAVVARACAALVIGFGLLVQVLVQQSWVIDRTRAIAEAPTAAVSRVGDKLVAVRTLAADVGAGPFADAVGADHVIQVIALPGDSGNVLVAPCRTLATLGRLAAGCPASATPMPAAYTSLTDLGQAIRLGTEISDRSFTVSTAPPARGQPQAFFVINPAGQDGLETVKHAAYAHLAKPYVSTPGEEWIVGGLAGVRAYNWLLMLGCLGLAVLVLAGGLSAIGVFLTQVDSVGVLSTYDARPRRYLAIATWNLGLPLALAGTTGAVISIAFGWLSIQMRSRGELPLPALGWGILAILALAAAMTAAGSVLATAAARTWRPSND